MATTTAIRRWDSSTHLNTKPTSIPKHPVMLNSIYDAESIIKVSERRRSTRLLATVGTRFMKDSGKSKKTTTPTPTKGSAMIQKNTTRKYTPAAIESYYLPSWRSTEITPLHGIHIIPSLLPADLCETIVYEASRTTFTNKRHKHFPTVDVPLRQLMESYRRFYPFLHTKIYPMIKELYQLKDAHFNVVDLFVVRYSARGQCELKEHRDGSIISFNISLNELSDYQGGGTKFAGVPGGLTIKNDKGGMVLHCGKIKHSGVKIHGRASTRFILVGFLNCVSPSLINESKRLALRSLTSDDEYLRGLYTENRLGKDNTTSLTSPMCAPPTTMRARPSAPPPAKLRQTSSGSGLLSCFSRRTRQPKQFPQTLPKP